MVKKFISISLIAFMAFTFATPLFSTEDCTSPCCPQVEKNCCIQQDAVDCPIVMTSCETPIALLLISGLEAKKTQTLDLNASQLYVYEIIDFGIEYNITSDIQNPSASPPTAFLTPLRI